MYRSTWKSEASDPQELGLWIVVSHHVVLGTDLGSLGEQLVSLTAEPCVHPLIGFYLVVSVPIVSSLILFYLFLFIYFLPQDSFSV